MRQKKLWRAKWVLAGDQAWQRSGGQGRLRLVLPKDHPATRPSVLKELKSQSDPDRRRRMRREVVTLETLPHSATPQVLDHNTEAFVDPNIELYAVFEFIPGPTLGEFVAENGPMELADGIALVTALLAILEVYHDAGSGHRDIKPENIILRDSYPESPVLIDFGLSFNVDELSSTDTPDWQQVGNRFLALPEHAAFSGNKHDLRSDLTFCVAILFFALTGARPATLADEDSRLPHQRSASRKALDAISEQQRLTLLGVFDIGFSLNVAQRWQSIDALSAQIQRIMEKVTDKGPTEASILELRARAAAKSGNLAIKLALDQVRARLKSATQETVAKLGDGFVSEISERLTTMHDMSTWIRCGVAPVYVGGVTNTYFGVKAVGDELIITEIPDDDAANGVIFARIPSEAPESLPDLAEMVERRIVENLSRDVSSR